MIDIIYLAFNRLEFTRETLAAVAENTNWAHVRKMIIYDDGSTDGTREFVREFKCPAPVEFRFTKLGGPVAITNNYLGNKPADMFAKLDNDTMVPPHWLDECLKVMGANTGLGLLGIEAFNEIMPGVVPRGYKPAKHIGGIGLMRRKCFFTLPKANGRHGFTQWQWDQKHILKGWINPSIPVFLLDRMPMEPWAGLNGAYIAKGWSRKWSAYDDTKAALWAWKYGG